ncbi:MULTISPECIES: DUF1064 domain-containing protein [Paenibacillus]|uniref:DUF1064 domain-containing protein n=1 Tax=Paenibacillus TaxID=44249 RepID=UPI00096E917A|nr:DUF1064 domain-containing protein [Paenibacillus peoriae]OMF70363.1 hypothetical protein BK143_17810 [Paenibacillus peoriae]OMF81292.1 hypothetical protein BK145_07690 [Paenibacillus peoriae]
MHMSEADLMELLTSNPHVKIREQDQRLVKPREPLPTQRPTFDSEVEERFYNKRIVPLIIAGFLHKLELHKTFEIVEAVEHCGKKYKKRVYTPDFYMELKDGSVEVVEVKGRIIKKLQRDYPLRRQLFILNYCLPNNWKFLEVHDDEI